MTAPTLVPLSVPSFAKALEADKQRLAQHPLYAAVDSLPKLRTFTQHHVACVWDFMSLLKSLQRDLAPTTVPWLPPADPQATRMIHEIVLDEESDVLPWGGHGSHFEWYLAGMRELGADTRPVERWIAAMRQGHRPLGAMALAGMPQAAAAFVAETLAVLEEPLAVQEHRRAHGREDLIPRMFLPLLQRLRGEGLPCERLLAYIQRHIDVDGGAHGAHAGALLARLCAASPELNDRALAAAARAIDARARLWDAIRAAL
jgi:hypothetical protein